MTFGCKNTPPNYETKLQQELKSEEINNDIFLGFTLQMPKEDFYARCWDMNKEGQLLHGSSNASVLYKLENEELKFPARMEFYPDFYQGKVYQMLTEFKYAGWAPWNKEMHAEYLIKDVYTYLKKQHGDFFLADLENKGKVLCNLNGNRRIIITRISDESKVQVIYSDMTVYPEAQAEKEARVKNTPQRRVPAWATPK